jgi:hypothetical protein
VVLEEDAKELLARDVERKRFGATMSNRHALVVLELGIAASGAELDGQILIGEQHVPTDASLTVMATVLSVGLARTSSVAD